MLALGLALCAAVPVGGSRLPLPDEVLAQQSGPPARQPPDDFDLLPKEAPVDPAALSELERSLARRRTMLQLHQLAGFITLAGLALSVASGQVAYADKYGGGGDTGNFYQLHRWTAIGSSVLFAATASLSVFAPTPIEKKLRLDTATLHKICMSVAAAGMAAEIVLGLVTAGKEGRISQRDFALAHQVIGYATLVAAVTGFTVLTF